MKKNYMRLFVFILMISLAGCSKSGKNKEITAKSDQNVTQKSEDDSSETTVSDEVTPTIENQNVNTGPRKAVKRQIIDDTWDCIFFSDNTVTICRYITSDAEENLEVPAAIEGSKVTYLGNGCFKGMPFENVTLPDGLTHIGDMCFFNCSSLESINIPQSVTEIGYKAFIECSALESITIPENVVKIGPFAFSECEALEKVDILGAADIGDSAFEECESLTDIKLVKPARIGNNAFYDCNSMNESLVIPGSAKEIGNDAFYNDGVKKVTIENGVEIIGNEAFNDLTDIKIPDSVSIIGQDFVNPYSSWYKNLSDEFVIVGDGVLIKYNGDASDITIPKNVKYIVTLGPETYCSKITVPATLQGIGNSAFSSHLESITLPKTLKNIKNFGLDSSWYQSQGDFVIAGDSVLIAYLGDDENVTIPDGVKYIGNYAFGDNGNIKNIVIPKSVKEIFEYAFWGCGNLKTIKIPDGVTCIGDYAFSGSGLKSIEIPDSVITMGKGVFSGCSKLATVKLPAKLTYISDYMFDSCESLKELTIPEGVTGIGYQTGYNYAKLIIPKSVKEIGCLTSEHQYEAKPYVKKDSYAYEYFIQDRNCEDVYAIGSGENLSDLIE